ncbi:MAG: lycopene cyclase domain-containing protein [Treponema sp.]|nr:lycopene cyclase domain-containing protein [Treponema sp.]
MAYILLDLLVLLFPLALSFDRKVAFYKSWPAVFPTILVILLLFGSWDVWKTSIGVWSFSVQYAGTWRLMGLPAGEWLFFICVPYACIFILACVRSYIQDHQLPIPLWLWYVLSGAFILAGLLLMHKTYTGIVFLSVAAAILAVRILSPNNFRSSNFWIALAITYVPFLIANGVLTGLPVVLYDNSRNLNIRVGPIPIEDFFFSLSMLLLSFALYDFFGRKQEKHSLHKRVTALE